MSMPEQEPFRLNQLIYDKRYRSYTIQFIALCLFLLTFAWLVSNAVANLEALGKDFSFSFLWQPASYDINQTLIDYTSRSPHWRAALVGILNTLVVAFLGCVLATIVGVAIGVARLSRNWLVSKLMTVYIEGFRNVPVLLWILLTSTFLSAGLPSPRQAPVIGGGLLVPTNRGFYIPSPVYESGAAIVGLVFLLSLVAIFFFRRYARQRQAATGEILPVLWITLAILFVPTILAYAVLGAPIALEYPELKGFNFQGGLYIRSSFVALWLALSLYTAAFIAENVRAGIQAISHGQTEAARSLGLRPGPTLRKVIIPQAMRVIIPPLTSQYLNLAKNSSLAAGIGYPDMVSLFAGTVLNQTGQAIEVMAITMSVYLAISISISLLMNWYNKRIALIER